MFFSDQSNRRRAHRCILTGTCTRALSPSWGCSSASLQIQRLTTLRSPGTSDGVDFLAFATQIAPGLSCQPSLPCDHFPLVRAWTDTFGDAQT